jgi:hypothetical protein
MDGQRLKSNHFVDVVGERSATLSRTQFEFKGGVAKSLLVAEGGLPTGVNSTSGTDG